MSLAKMKTKFSVRHLWCFNTPEGDEDLGGGGGADPAATPAPVVEDFDAAKAAENAVASLENDANKPPAIEWAKHVPEDLKDAPWIKDILNAENPTERFFKDMAGLQSKLGQRVEGVPKADAAPEEWDKFYSAMGRPEKADDYEVPADEWPEELKQIGEFVDAAAGANNPAYIQKLKEVAHFLGVPKEKFPQAYKMLNEGFIESNKEFFETAMNAKNESDFDYANKMVAKFGARAEQVQNNVSKLLELTGDEDSKKAAQNMSNEELVRLALVTENIRAKYISEDTFSKEGTTATLQSDAEKRQHAMKLMASPAFEDHTHPDHEKVNAEVNALYGIKKK